MRVLWRLMRYQRPYWRLVVLTYIAVAAATALALAVPDVVRASIDRVVLFEGQDGLALSLLIAAGSIIGITLLRGAFAFAQRYWTEVIAQRVAYDLRNRLYDHLQRLSFDFHDRASTGDLMSRLTSDVEVTRVFIGQALPELATTLLLLVGVAIQLFRLNQRLAIWSLSLVLPMLVLAIHFGVTQRPFFLRAQRYFGHMITVLQENLAGVRVVRAFAREPYEVEKFSGASADYRHHRMLAIGRWVAHIPLIIFLGTLMIVVALWVGGPMVVRGEITVGTLTAFTIYLSMLTMPIRMLGFVVNLLARATASGDRLFEILDARSSIVERPDAVELPPLRGEVRFENVSFAYSHSPDRPVIQNISLTARPGAIIALLGPTGSGKSTITSLIPRFYDPTEGRVLIDGYDVRDVTLDSLRRQIGVVLQESFLFSTTIRENIAYGMPDASDEEIEAAARAAQAHDFIVNLPAGYQTRIGERGVTLSGGQRQRIAIARAILRNPRILILDDATASVDTETEYAIQRALAHLMQGRTTFVIAHRLATLRRADLILVLDQGRMIQRGTHRQLLDQAGLYRRIYDLQFREQEDYEQIVRGTAGAGP